MKTFTALCLIVTVAISLPQFALGQGNPEATKFAKEGAQANRNQDWDKAIDAFSAASKSSPGMKRLTARRANPQRGTWAASQAFWAHHSSTFRTPQR